LTVHCFERGKGKWFQVSFVVSFRVGFAGMGSENFGKAIAFCTLLFVSTPLYSFSASHHIFKIT